MYKRRYKQFTSYADDSHLASGGFSSLAVTFNRMSRRVCLSFTRQTKTIPLSSLTLTSSVPNDICTAMNIKKIT